MGLRYVVVDENLKDKMKLAVDHGVLVMGHGKQNEGVVPGSPAHKAGIKEKDIIFECNGQKLTEEKTIQDFLEDMSVGEKMSLKIMRGNKEVNADVVLAERK